MKILSIFCNLFEVISRQSFGGRDRACDCDTRRSIISDEIKTNLNPMRNESTCVTAVCKQPKITIITVFKERKRELYSAACNSAHFNMQRIQCEMLQVVRKGKDPTSRAPREKTREKNTEVPWC